jgi:hypothetical protein
VSFSLALANPPNLVDHHGDGPDRYGTVSHIERREMAAMKQRL